MSDMLNSAAASYILAGGLTPDTTAEWQRLFDQVLQKNQELVQRCNEEVAKGAGQATVVAAMLMEAAGLIKDHPELATYFTCSLPDQKEPRSAIRREAEAECRKAIEAGQTISTEWYFELARRVIQRESKK